VILIDVLICRKSNGIVTKSLKLKNKLSHVTEPVFILYINQSQVHSIMELPITPLKQDLQKILKTTGYIPFKVKSMYFDQNKIMTACFYTSLAKRLIHS
jgi:hypothetical protein